MSETETVTVLTDEQVTRIEERVSAYAAGAAQPGLAFGIVAGGTLVYSGGRGERWKDGPEPDADTVFRIASMTKSFTAATVLSLRDESALALDDLAERYVGEVRGVALPTTDSPRPTLRHLLTMTGGFPADDPWGDRQQGLDPAAFAALLRDGGTALAWVPGTRFEYSNLGYAILGRVIEAVTGGDYAAAIRARMLDPLGMARTGYEIADFDPGLIARGHVRRRTGWTELVPDTYGAFAPMGGIFTTVRDLTRWVSGFADAFPPRDEPGADHPLTRATRREMQLSHVTRPLEAAEAATYGYGFGLFVDTDPALGLVVHHSGGYPGYGSQMRWHPATGLGVIVLGNGTYAPVGMLAGQLLADLAGGRPAAPSGVAPGPVVRGPAPQGRPWPRTVAAREAADKLLRHWDDAGADALFTPNVAWDRPYADRRAEIEQIRDRIGDFGADPQRPPEYESPARCRWWLRGERGAVQAEVQLTPLAEARVLALRVAVPPAPGSVLLRALDALIGLLNDDPVQWPDWLPVASGVPVAGVLHRLRVAAAWAGRAAVTGFTGGDGQATSVAELTGPDGRVALRVTVDPDAGLVRTVGVTLLPWPGTSPLS